MTLVAAQGLCPQEANMCCVLTLQTGLGRSRRITQSPLGWNGEETSKFNQQQVWHPLGKSWLGFDSPALLLKHLPQFSLCRIEIFMCVPMCDSMIIYKTKFHLKKKIPKKPRKPHFVEGFNCSSEKRWRMRSAKSLVMNMKSNNLGKQVSFFLSL